MWAWADMRKLKPIHDYRDTIDNDDEEHLEGMGPDHWERGINRKYLFAIWPEFSGDSADLDDELQGWEDFKEICDSGFDTTRYACEILKNTIEWVSNLPARRENLALCGHICDVVRMTTMCFA